MHPSGKEPVESVCPGRANLAGDWANTICLLLGRVFNDGMQQSLEGS